MLFVEHNKNDANILIENGSFAKYGNDFKYCKIIQNRESV